MFVRSVVLDSGGCFGCSGSLAGCGQCSECSGVFGCSVVMVGLHIL